MSEHNVTVTCGQVNGGGDLGVRISSIFVILIGSLLGALLPIFLARTKHAEDRRMKAIFFIVKYFGSGVIIGTAFIHLLTPATQLLQSPCLSGPITEYSWAEGICLITVFTMFFIELMAARLEFMGGGDHHKDVEAAIVPARVTGQEGEGPQKGRKQELREHNHPSFVETAERTTSTVSNVGEVSPPSSNSSPSSVSRLLQRSRLLFHSIPAKPSNDSALTQMAEASVEAGNESRGQFDGANEGGSMLSQTGTIGNDVADNDFSYPPGGADHLGHQREHKHDSQTGLVAAQLTSIFILEFGVIFHSIFIGLTLAVAGDEFTILYVVLAFHQTFEGLGLGTRLALTPWPKNKSWLPWVLGAAFGVTTPIAIGVGLGVRTTFQPGSPSTMIVNGIFDSISAGVLIYTGLIELMAHEFMFNEDMRKASIKTTLFAFGCMCFGAGLMALLGKWA